jgi:hypothetical protein
MATKTKNEMPKEKSEMKGKLNNLQQNFDKLSEEHKTLQTELVVEKETNKTRCNNCFKTHETCTILKKYKNDIDKDSSVFKKHWIVSSFRPWLPWGHR